MSEYYGDDCSGMTNETLEADQESWDNSYAHSADLQARAERGESISAKCDYCGKTETVSVGTQFKDVAWGNNKNHTVSCNTCATDRARGYGDASRDVSGKEQAQNYLAWLAFGLIVVGIILYRLVGGL